MKKTTKLILLLGGLFFYLSNVLALNQPSVIEVMQKVSPALVMVKSENAQIYRGEDKLVGDKATGRIMVVNPVGVAQYARTGGGVVIDVSGMIITNAHLVHQAGRITILFNDGKEFTAELIFEDLNDDLALLKINPSIELDFISFSDESKISLGMTIYNVGSSSILKGAFSEGRIIGLGTKNAGDGKPGIELLKVSFNVYQGDSGGPILDSEGRLVGLVSAGAVKGDTISIAVPVNKIRDFCLRSLNAKTR